MRRGTSTEARSGADRAVLLFADSLPLDLARRRWPRGLERLLATPSVEDLSPEIDLHLFTSVPGPVPAAERFVVHAQQGRSFGAKLTSAVEKLFASGYSQVVVIGRDCPELTQDDIRRSFAELENHDVVLGPDHRGGVYLIGLRAESRFILSDIHWCQDRDFHQLRSRAKLLSTLILPTKQDLDNLGDLARLSRFPGPLRSTAKALLLTLLLREWRPPGDSALLPKALLVWRVHLQLPPPQPSPRLH